MSAKRGLQLKEHDPLFQSLEFRAHRNETSDAIGLEVSQCLLCHQHFPAESGAQRPPGSVCCTAQWTELHSGFGVQPGRQEWLHLCREACVLRMRFDARLQERCLFGKG
jgi:hypothetical protein